MLRALGLAIGELVLTNDILGFQPTQDLDFFSQLRMSCPIVVPRERAGNGKK